MTSQPADQQRPSAIDALKQMGFACWGFVIGIMFRRNEEDPAPGRIKELEAALLRLAAAVHDHADECEELIPEDVGLKLRTAAEKAKLTAKSK